MADRKRALREPSFVRGTIRQAKRLVTKAFDALTNGTTLTPSLKRRAAKKSMTKRPRRKRAARAMAQAATHGAATHAGRGKQHTTARKVRRAVANTKRAARKATQRRAARKTGNRRVGR